MSEPLQQIEKLVNVLVRRRAGDPPADFDRYSDEALAASLVRLAVQHLSVVKEAADA